MTFSQENKENEIESGVDYYELLDNSQKCRSSNTVLGLSLGLSLIFNILLFIFGWYMFISCNC